MAGNTEGDVVGVGTFSSKKNKERRMSPVKLIRPMVPETNGAGEKHCQGNSSKLLFPRNHYRPLGSFVGCVLFPVELTIRI